MPYKIKEVRAYISTNPASDYHRQTEGHWIADLISYPMSVYQKKPSSTSWGIGALGTVITEVELDNGIVGIGCSTGGDQAAYIIENNLSKILEGQDPRNVELMWDMMYRATLPYGRKGITIHAISAVDLAIWDCLGKLYNQPIYSLLGGKTKDKLPIYCTSPRPDIAKKQGFKGAKISLPYGPAEGEEGFIKNIDFIAAARASVGPDFPLMIDCYMNLTVPYTLKLIQAIKPYNITWVEESLHSDDYEGYAEVRRKVGDKIMLTSGEHEVSRYGFRQLIEKKCCDILQPDINWVGGLTEARRIVAMAAAHDIPVIPHGSSVFGYHLQMAFTNCPMGEYLNMSPKADEIVPVFEKLFTNEPLPKDGFIELSDAPGWGVELNKKDLKLLRPYDRSIKRASL